MKSRHCVSKTLWLYLTVLAVAAGIRILLFYSYLHSPVRYFSYIPGLDMQTILWLGVLFHDGQAHFSIDRLLAAVTYVMNGNKAWPEAFTFVQMLLGCGTALFIAGITLHLTGKRILALASGIIAATYVPELIYETITLRESIYIFFAVMGLAITLPARSVNAGKWILFWCGVAIVLPACLRFAGILWVAAAVFWLWLAWRRKGLSLRNKIGRLSTVALGVIVVIMICSLINFLNIKKVQPFPVSLAHVALVSDIASRAALTEVNPEALTVTGGTSSLSRYRNMFMRIPEHCLALVKPFEISNNINYYFVKPLIPWLRFLPGSMLIIPLAVTGLIVLLFSGGFRGKQSILFFYFIAYALPLVTYVPLSRYRLVLLPVFCFSAIWLCWTTYNLIFRKCYFRLVGLMLLIGTVFFVTWPRSLPVRVADYITLGKAFELKNKHADAMVAGCYLNALRVDPESLTAALNLGRVLLTMGKNADAELILSSAFQRDPGNFGVVSFYASALLANGKPAEALDIVKRIQVPESSSQRLTYFFTLGECQKLNGNKELALQAYQQAVKYTQTDIQRRNINHIITTLER